MANSILASNSSIKSYPSSVQVEGCRYCSKQYNFRLPSNTLVTVLCGRPPPQTSYKAVSYLWENTILLNLECLKCNNTKSIPMRDGDKLLQILAFVGGTSKVWLDALSIDQDNDSDLKEQLVVMGDIYQNAEEVSVFLPSQDEAAYKLLAKLATKSDTIVKTYNRLGGSGIREMNQEQKANLISLANEYATIVEEWDANIFKWKYWKRAWTFQEWTMAAEVEIIYEGIPGNVFLKCIKNVIVMASSITSRVRHYFHTKWLVVFLQELQGSLLKYSAFYSANILAVEDEPSSRDRSRNQRIETPRSCAISNWNNPEPSQDTFSIPRLSSSRRSCGCKNHAKTHLHDASTQPRQWHIFTFHALFSSSQTFRCPVPA